MKPTSFLMAIVAIMFAVMSCKKENSIPKDQNVVSATSSEKAVVADTSITFIQGIVGTVYYSPGINPVQTGDFVVSGDTGKFTKLIYILSGNNVPVINVNSSGTKFYLNGGEIRANITQNATRDTLTVAFRKVVPLQPGNYTYLLNLVIPSGGDFSITLSSVEFTRKNGFTFQKFGLPVIGNHLISN